MKKTFPAAGALIIILVVLSGCFTSSAMLAQIQKESSKYCDGYAKTSGNLTNPTSATVSFDKSTDMGIYDNFMEKSSLLNGTPLARYIDELKEINSAETTMNTFQCSGRECKDTGMFADNAYNCECTKMGWLGICTNWHCCRWALPTITTEKCESYQKSSTAGAHFNVFSSLMGESSFTLGQLMEKLEGQTSAKCVGYCGNGKIETAAETEEGKDEQCDLTNIGNAKCPAGTTGTPACNADCALDISVTNCKPVACVPKTCSDYSGKCGTVTEDRCNTQITCNCQGSQECINGTCTQNPPCTNATDCKPQACKTSACTGGQCVYTPIAAGLQQTGICDATKGCTTPPCQCDGAGACTTKSEICGNNKREGSEECDGTDLAGKTCSDFDPKTTGILQCSKQCKFDKTGCKTKECSVAADCNTGNKCLTADCTDYKCIFTPKKCEDEKICNKETGECCAPKWKDSGECKTNECPKKCSVKCKGTKTQTDGCGNTRTIDCTVQGIECKENEVCEEDKCVSMGTSCESPEGETGYTGAEAVPKIILDWSWSDKTIPLEACEKDYCDPVQFTITLMKRLHEINAKGEEIFTNPEKYPGLLEFRARLIGDNYSQTFLNDFANYDGFFEIPDWFKAASTPYNEYLKKHKIAFSPQKIITGTYNAKIQIQPDSGEKKLFSGSEPNCTITIKLDKTSDPAVKNQLYYLPINGKIGLENRQGYGIQVINSNDPIPINSDVLLENGPKGAAKKVIAAINNSFEILNTGPTRGVVLEIKDDAKQITLGQSKPVSVLGVFSASEKSKDELSYKLFSGREELKIETGNASVWTAFASENDCVDFDGKPLPYRTEDLKRQGNSVCSGTMFEIAQSSDKNGKAFYSSVFYKPKNDSVLLMACAKGNQFATKEKSMASSADALQLDDESQETAASIQQIFDLIKQQKICSAVLEDRTIFYWNEQELEKEIQPRAKEFSDKTIEECTEKECTDSDVTDEFPDGKNYYQKGTATGLESAETDSCALKENAGESEGSYSPVSQCEGEKCYLMEKYCSPGIKTDYKACQAGCRDGACAKQGGKESTCTDSDGGQNYTKQGIFCIGNECGKDICEKTETGMKLREYYCINPVEFVSELYSCQNGMVCYDGKCTVQKCGDRICSGTENCSNCPRDCGCGKNGKCLSEECCQTNNVCGETCCPSPKKCDTRDFTCRDSCPVPDTNTCGNYCCAKGKECYEGVCCKPEKICNGVCCPDNKSCIEGSCKNSYDLCPSLNSLSKNKPAEEPEIGIAIINGQEIKVKGSAAYWGDANNLTVFDIGSASDNQTNTRIIVELQAPSVIKALEQNLGKDYIPQGTTLSKTDILNAETTIEQQQTSVYNSIKAVYPKVTQTSSFKLGFNGITLDLKGTDSLKVIKSLKANSNVKEVYQNLEVKATLDQTVPIVKADKAWDLIDSNGQKVTGKGIRVGVIDTGVDYNHPDLGGCLGEGCKVAGGYDFINYDSDPMDDMGHGTHVAGIIAAKGDLNGIAPDATIYGIKVLNSGGSGSLEGVMQGIEWAIDPNQDGDPSDHLDVINMSLGASTNDPDNPVSIKSDNASEAGIAVVVSAGNSGPYENSIGAPGSSREAITVGATYKGDLGADMKSRCTDKAPQEQNQLACFSSRGNAMQILKPDIVAPGVSICSDRWDSAFESRVGNPDRPDMKLCSTPGHIAISGTSMSSPVVAGATALIRQAHPEWNPRDIKSAIQFSAQKLQNYSQIDVGYGLLDSLGAINQDILVDSMQKDLGKLSGTENRTIAYTFKNVSSEPKKIKLEFKDEKNHGPFTENGEACIEPGEQKKISFEVTEINKLEYGDILKEITLQTFDNCTDSTPKKETALHYSMKKIKTLNVQINVGKQFSSEGLLYSVYLFEPGRSWITGNDAMGGWVDFFEGGTIEKTFEIPREIGEFAVVGVFFHESKEPEGKYKTVYLAKGGSLEGMEETTIAFSDSTAKKIQTNLADFFVSKGLLVGSLSLVLKNPCGVYFTSGTSSIGVEPCKTGSDSIDAYFGAENLPSFCKGKLNLVIDTLGKNADKNINSADTLYAFGKIVRLENDAEFTVSEKDFEKTRISFCEPGKSNSTGFAFATIPLRVEGMSIIWAFLKPEPMADKNLNYVKEETLAQWYWYLQNFIDDKDRIWENITNAHNFNGKFFPDETGAWANTMNPNFPVPAQFQNPTDFCIPKKE